MKLPRFWGMIESERHDMRRDPDNEARLWVNNLAETDRIRRGYQELATKGYMTTIWARRSKSSRNPARQRSASSRKCGTVKANCSNWSEIETSRATRGVPGFRDVRARIGKRAT
jgi:hypothetical protein